MNNIYVYAVAGLIIIGLIIYIIVLHNQKNKCKKDLKKEQDKLKNLATNPIQTIQEVIRVQEAENHNVIASILQTNTKSPVEDNLPVPVNVPNVNNPMLYLAKDVLGLQESDQFYQMATLFKYFHEYHIKEAVIRSMADINMDKDTNLEMIREIQSQLFANINIDDLKRALIASMETCKLSSYNNEKEVMDCLMNYFNSNIPVVNQLKENIKSFVPPNQKDPIDDLPFGVDPIDDPIELDPIIDDPK